MEIRVARACFTVASFFLILGGAGCGSSNSNATPPTAPDAGPPTAAELGAQYKFDPNDVPGWQLDPNDSMAFQILEEGTPTDLYSFMDGGSDLYTNAGCTVTLYESLRSTNQELDVIEAMYFGTAAKAAAMFVTNSAGASVPVPNYNASDAIGKSALVQHTVYAHIGVMYYEMQASGFADATSAFQASSQILDVFKKKTH